MNNKLTLITLMVLSFMCVTLSFVHAAGMNKGEGQGKNRNLNTQQPAFSFFDLDNDQLISAQEFEQARTKIMADKTAEGRMLQNRNQERTFTELDANGDGFINGDEFQAHQQNAVKTQTRATKARMDKQLNKNRQKTQNRMTNRQQPSFSEFDTNGDNRITEEEFNALRKERVQELTEEGRALQNVNQVSAFASYDKNKDGVLSEEEFSAHRRYLEQENKNAEKEMNKNSNSNSNTGGNGKG